MTDFLHIIKTRSYKNDSRLLKWVSSLNEEKYVSDIFILEDNNEELKWKEGENRVHAIALITRKYFKKGRGYIFKIPEFTFKSIKYIGRSNAKVIVFHDMQHYLTLFFLCFKKKRKIVWDLHELPHEILTKSYISRKIIQFILSSVDLLVYTNVERRNYMLKKFKHTEKDYVILNNYTDRSYFEISKSNLPLELEKWLDNKKYILWLGNAVINRNFLVALKALIDHKKEIRLIILGKIDPEVASFIKKNNLESFIYSTFVIPVEMINYIDNALFSIVLYKNISPNNFYCEPNRLYQLTARKIPVITGNNPPMRSIVEKYQSGIVLSDDGSDVQMLSKAIEEMFKEYEKFKTNLEKADLSKTLSWEMQFSQVIKSLENLENKK